MYCETNRHLLCIILAKKEGEVLYSKMKKPNKLSLQTSDTNDKQLEKK